MDVSVDLQDWVGRSGNLGATGGPATQAEALVA
jgi:hypothetical protein